VRYRKIGRTDITASVVTFGAMGIGGGFRFPGTDDAVSVRAVRAALDRGITTFDTAPVYGFGHSEEVLGTALRGRRDEAVISTKCGLWWGDDAGTYRFTWEGHAVKRNLSPRTIRIEVEESLRRLQTDRIDVYYTHNPAQPPFLTPIEDTIATLLDLRDEGKILAIGASNCPPEDVQAHLDAGAIEIVQRKYNVLEREIEQDILPLVEANGLSLHAYSPLASGLLSGRFGADYTPDPAEPRASSPLFSEHVYPLTLAFLDGFRAVADEVGASLPALAVAHLLAASPAVNVISGIRKEEHLDAVVEGAELELDAAAVARIRELSDRFQEQRAASGS